MHFHTEYDMALCIVFVDYLTRQAPLYNYRISRPVSRTDPFRRSGS